MTAMQTLKEPSPVFNRVAEFVQGLSFEQLPEPVRDFAALLLLDLIGVAAAAARMPAARIACDHAVAHWAASPGAASARLLFDGRHASLPGAAFALAAALDNLDAHDGWQPSKGHAGAAIFPALVALADSAPAMSGPEALAAMVVGYEVAYRAAAALHATTVDYHTSGAWNALGCAAVAARVRGLGRERLRQALGIAEFHAPRSQMLREIANPSMLHDGTAWGAPAGVAAALLAEAGFQGAPAALVEFDDAAFAWRDLGERWLTIEQYIKHYPVCRWAHAPIDAALLLRARHAIDPARVVRIEIDTFQYAAALWNEVPPSSPVAQYALAWPVSAALARGRVGIDEVMETSFADPAIVRLTRATVVRIDAECERAYPARRLGGIAIELDDGQRFASGLCEASGGPVPRPTEAEVVRKFRAFASPATGKERAADIERAVLGLGAPDADFKALLELLAPPALSGL
jgi:2-methylcitrate dehydratase PrpD